MYPESSSDALVVAAHIQTSAVLAQVGNRRKPEYGAQSGSVRTLGKVRDDHLSLALDCGPAITSCGHAMHAKCYQNFVDNLVKKERTR